VVPGMMAHSALNWKSVTDIYNRALMGPCRNVPDVVVGSCHIHYRPPLPMMVFVWLCALDIQQLQ